MNIYMLRKEEIKETWDDGASALKTFIIALYLGSLIGPAIEGIVRAIINRDKDWLVHPMASFISVTGTITGMIKYRMNKKNTETN